MKRPLLAALALAVGAALALAGLLGASSGAPLPPAPAPHDASRPAERAVAAPADATSVECRMIGTDFAADPTDLQRAWSQLRNVGPTAVSLSAIEVGWRGAAVLESVLVRRAGGETSFDVHDGPATSPALLFLKDPVQDGSTLQIGSGEAVDVGLLFSDEASGQLPDLIGPAVVHMLEGCAIALGGGTGLVPECALGLGKPTLSGQSANQVDIELRNSGEEPLALATIELSWPTEENGDLAVLQMDGADLLRFDAPRSASPAVIDLRRLGAGQAVVKHDASRTLSLVFEQGAAAGPYAVTVTTAGGCTARASTWLDDANGECGVRPVGFDVRGDTAQLRLSNPRPITHTLTAMDLFWPATATGPLSEVRVNGSQVWRGEESSSPASVTLTGALLAPEATAEVQLVFTSTIRSNFALKGGSGGDYTVVAHLPGGCQAVFSTIAGRPTGCSLSATDLALDPAQRRVSTTLTSLADDAVLQLASVSWPSRNGDLIGAWLSDDLLFSGQEPPSTKPFEIRLAGRSAVVPRSQTRELRLGFADRVSRNGYVLSLTFEDPSGAPCELMVQSRPVEPDCRLSLGALRADLRDVLLPLRNEGLDEAEIRYLDVDWPTDGLNGLNQVALLDDGAAEPRVVWAPTADERPKMRSPARVVPNGTSSPIVDSGVTVTLRLRFTELMNTADVANALKLTVAAAEGCVATYSPDGSRLPQQTVSFDGVIRELPRSRPGEAGLFGIWRIDNGGTEMLVEVDSRTSFVPPTVTPEEGDIVHVVALRTDEDKLLAEEITFRSSEKATTLIGSIDALDTDNPRPTWLDVRIGNAVQRVRIVDSTVIAGILAVGAEVTVEGTERPGEDVTAIRIQVTSPPKGEFIVVRGVIQRAEHGVTAGDQQWVVDKYDVRVPQAYAPDTVPAGSLPADGQHVELYGQLTGREIRVAQKVKLLAAPRVRQVLGYLRELPPNSLLGNWVVETTSGATQKFLVDSLAVIDTNVAPADLGLWVIALVQDTSDGATALRIRMDWQP